MCAALAGACVAAVLMSSTRHFFALSIPDTGMILASGVPGATVIGALVLCGYTVLTTPQDKGQSR